MAESDIASTTGAEHAANVRRRNVPGAEQAAGVPTSYATDDDGKKVKPRVWDSFGYL